MLVEKRDGRIVPFDKEKIVTAIEGAFVDLDKASEYSHTKAREIANFIANTDRESISVEEIQDIIEQKLMASQAKDVAKAFILYRDKRTKFRDNKSALLQEAVEVINGDNKYWLEENSNKNPILNSTVRDYLAGIVSTNITRNKIMDEELRQAHDDGLIHWHDADYSGRVRGITNCCLLNLEDMLQNSTVINRRKIDKPHRLLTACTIATQIIASVTSAQYGGCSVSLAHLAPFVRDSYNAYLEKYREYGLSETDCINLADEDIKKEISDSVQTFNYQLNTISNTNGQSPFITVWMYLGETEEYKHELAMLIEEFLHQRIKGMPNEDGVFVTQEFPKLVYCLEEDNMYEESPYWYLTELSAECTAKRMVPDYVSEKMMLEYKGDVYPPMGCRSFLTPDVFTAKGIGNIANATNYEEGKRKYWGRFNQGVVTINLPDVAFTAINEERDFWDVLDERLELCHKALRLRHETLIGTPSDVAPILWQAGGFARLNKGEKIDRLLYDGYSTISLGYVGLYECVKAITGHSHSDGADGEAFGLAVMQRMLDKCNEWKQDENIHYSPYGTPMEATVEKFANNLKKRWGNDIFIKLDGHDRKYITNSYHIPVFEKIDPFEKLEVESKFQKLSAGGMISYVETCDLTNNIPVVLEVMRFIYDNVMYAELNTKSDYCQCCGYDGEIKIVDDGNELVWECPNCGNRDKSKMNVARRTCGYIGSNFWNQARTNEIQERYVHIDDHAMEE